MSDPFTLVKWKYHIELDNKQTGIIVIVINSHINIQHSKNCQHNDGKVLNRNISVSDVEARGAIIWQNNQGVDQW